MTDPIKRFTIKKGKKETNEQKERERKRASKRERERERERERVGREMDIC